MKGPTAVWTERALLVAGAVLLGVCAAVWLEARVYGVQQERQLRQMISASSEAIEAPSRPRSGTIRLSSRTSRRKIAAEDLVGRIEIPRLGIKAIVAEGVSSRTLRRAVGHLPGTALPGEAGNVVVAGHRDTFFRPLKDVRPGDEVTLTTPHGRFEYTVAAAEVVAPTRTDLLDSTEEPALTLVTCYPFYLVGSAPERFVVRARPRAGP